MSYWSKMTKEERSAEMRRRNKIALDKKIANATGKGKTEKVMTPLLLIQHNSEVWEVSVDSTLDRKQIIVKSLEDVVTLFAVSSSEHPVSTKENNPPPVPHKRHKRRHVATKNRLEKLVKQISTLNGDDKKVAETMVATGPKDNFWASLRKLEKEGIKERQYIRIRKRLLNGVDKGD